MTTELPPLGKRIEPPKPEHKDYPAPGTDPAHFIFVGPDGKWYTAVPANEITA